MTTLKDILDSAAQRAATKSLPYAGELTPQEAFEVLQQNAASLVDVRSQAELDLVGSIQMASHIEWAFYPGMVPNDAFAAQLQNLIDKNQPIVFMCRTGGRSHNAAVAATALGYKAYNMLEGFEGAANEQKQRTLINGWKHAGLPWNNWKFNKLTDKYAEPLNGVDRYAVVGNPISHSKSPQIHAAFAKQTGQNISYEAILAPLADFKHALQANIHAGYRGINITVPFKFEAFAMCDALTERAKSAGAANTLTFKSGEIIGDNTDGVGLVNDIENNVKHALKGARILLLGAGGAAQGVLLPLLNANPASIVIANRTLAKAQQMAEKSGDSARVGACTFEHLEGQFDVIINATSTGLSDTALPISDAIFAENCLAYEMMYGRETPFMAQARKNGAQVTDGLGMLVEQAAEAFYIWRGVRPQTAPVIAMLRPK